MRTIHLWLALALVMMFLVLAGGARGEQFSLPQGASDAVGIFAGPIPLVPVQFLREGPNGVDIPSSIEFMLASPIVIELTELIPPANTQRTVSDTLTINALHFIFASDVDLPSEMEAIESEFTDALAIMVKSDDNPTPPGVLSDDVDFFSRGRPVELNVNGQRAPGFTFPEGNGGVDPAPINFMLPTDMNGKPIPIVVHLVEPGTLTDSDLIVIDQFNGSFGSDNDMFVAPSSPFQLDEKLFNDSQLPLFSISVISDVPEPSTLILLASGILSFGWALVRRHRR